MSKIISVICTGHKTRQLILIACLVVLFGFVLPVTALAELPVPAGAEPCAGCHEAETTAWQDSPHANASHNKGGVIGASCEDCHGAYVEGHPGQGVMRLTVDSSVCEICHSTTFKQWHGSIHAQAGVQCIGCHLSHSQEFRLTDEALCGSCHRDRLEDFSHTAHGVANVACTDCHLSSTATGEIAMVSTPADFGVLAPSHDFTGVSSEDCVKCHGQDVHMLLPGPEHVVDARLVAMADSVPELTTKLETTQQTNKTLQIMVPVSLGIGLGIGGVLGIAFMLVLCYINQRRAK
jgi:formate-dependent nitrite reductase cytochrome c552 subunit